MLFYSSCRGYAACGIGLRRFTGAGRNAVEIFLDRGEGRATLQVFPQVIVEPDQVLLDQGQLIGRKGEVRDLSQGRFGLLQPPLDGPDPASHAGFLRIQLLPETLDQLQVDLQADGEAVVAPRVD